MLHFITSPSIFTKCWCALPSRLLHCVNLSFGSQFIGEHVSLTVHARLVARWQCHRAYISMTLAYSLGGGTSRLAAASQRNDQSL